MSSPDGTPTKGVLLRPLEPGDAPVMAAWGDDLLFCDEAGWSRDLDPAERRERWAELVAEPPADLLRLAAVVDGEVVGYVDLHDTWHLDRRTFHRQFAITRDAWESLDVS